MIGKAAAFGNRKHDAITSNRESAALDRKNRFKAGFSAFIADTTTLYHDFSLPSFFRKSIFIKQQKGKAPQTQRCFSGFKQKKGLIPMESVLMEATPRLELGNKGFADLCLTTWLCRRNWSGLRGSNSLPPPWQGGALPDELNPQIGAFGRNRTNDTRIFSPLLYQLSYKGICSAQHPLSRKNSGQKKNGDLDGVRTHDL